MNSSDGNRSRILLSSHVASYYGVERLLRGVSYCHGLPCPHFAWASSSISSRHWLLSCQLLVADDVSLSHPQYLWPTCLRGQDWHPTRLALDSVSRRPEPFEILCREIGLASHFKSRGYTRISIAYLLPEIVQLVRGAANTGAMSLLQLQPLHSIRCESFDWDFAVL